LELLEINDDIIAPFARKNNEVIFAGGEEISDYQDIIGPDEKKTAAWEEIKTYFPGCTLHLHNVPETSPTVSVFQMEKEDTTPLMTLPPVLEKKARHEMERKIRKFEREQENIKIYDSENPVADTEVFLHLMKLDERKKRFLTLDMEDFFKKIIKEFQKNIVLTLLTINDVPTAGLLAFRYSDTLMGYNSGFNEERFSGAGFYLKAMHIQRAIDSGIKTYNFLQGNERYKYDLGGKDFFVYKSDITLSSPT
jgi:CelD/BcsL family acetyltransferase involved in cellulose biosynthesis